jgi:hypothetical protein
MLRCAYIFDVLRCPLDLGQLHPQQVYRQWITANVYGTIERQTGRGDPTGCCMPIYQLKLARCSPCMCSCIIDQHRCFLCCQYSSTGATLRAPGNKSMSAGAWRLIRYMHACVATHPHTRRMQLARSRRCTAYVADQSDRTAEATQHGSENSVRSIQTKGKPLSLSLLIITARRTACVRRLCVTNTSYEAMHMVVLYVAACLRSELLPLPYIARNRDVISERNNSCYGFNSIILSNYIDMIY